MFSHRLTDMVSTDRRFEGRSVYPKSFTELSLPASAHLIHRFLMIFLICIFDVSA
jgi:hypothetical protein